MSPWPAAPEPGAAMIIGLGSDIIDIRRIERTLERYGDRFLSRVFTPTERRKSDGRAGANRTLRAASYARRFAAKEACSKALGTGFRGGVYWRDMGVVNLATGQPAMELAGGAARRLREITPPGTVARLLVTITDDHPVAQAIVVISAVPDPLWAGSRPEKPDKPMAALPARGPAG